MNFAMSVRAVNLHSHGGGGHRGPPLLGTLDLYGGYVELPVAGGATGYFRIGQLGSRWIFVTPLGNAFWMRAVYVVSALDGGSRYSTALASKYSGTQFYSQSVIRLKAWGFNALGEYSNQNMWPIGMFGGGSGNAQQMPFIFLMNGSYYGGTHNIFAGVNTSINPSTYIGTFFDVYDPAFATQWDAGVLSQTNDVTGGATALTASPWYIGATTDDGDYTTGFGPGPDGAASQGKIHPHLGWVAAVTNPLQGGATIYTKSAFKDWLTTKYGTIGAMNTAWGSTYTTFGTQGAGWGSGTGFLDEDGRNAWVGTDDGNYLTTTSAGCKTDLNLFLSAITDTYFSVSTGAIRAKLPNHLVFSPATMQAGTRTEILAAAGPYVDAIQSAGVPGGVSDALWQAAYNVSGKPVFVWLTLTAQQDANLLVGFDPAGWGIAYNFATQDLRGSAYANEITRVIGLVGADGKKFVAGIDWWEWTDKTTGGENMNFGLVSNLDNGYDGVEARIAAGTDAWGYATGGETANYGDFLTSVRATHATIFALLAS